MSGKELWARTRDRMKSFPRCVAACAEDAALYGRCVAAAASRGQELKKDACAAEFQALKNCFTQAVSFRRLDRGLEG
uniref:NADH:ubiquinone oxidoreductase complex assembly factor 8 n=1 Tax=Callorhinchus milii TaxID=7868 RepID=V9LJG6_CALMI